MTRPESQPELEGRVQRLLADDDIAELGVEVFCEGDDLVLRGQVNTEHRRELIYRRVAEVAGGHHVRRELTIASVAPPEGPEATA